MDAEAGNSIQPSDEHLMLAYTSGDVEAFDRLYARHKDRLYRLFVQSTGAEPVARELFQDVWMRLVQHRSTYVDSAAFTTWLYRIARNRLTDYYRQQGKRGIDTEYDEQEPQSESVTVIASPLQTDELATLAERGELVQDALSKLSSSQREAVMLKHIAGMSIGEVADVTGENAETIKSRLRYAFTRLCQQLRVSR